jgi:CubicO group peptidase (beta-lactamase class C family)
LFSSGEEDRCGTTLALVVVRRGCIALERYGRGVEPNATQRSWSMAKSVLHAVVGQLIADRVLELEAPAPVPAWRGAGDPRAAIKLEHLLRMVDGLDFIEEYEEGQRCDVIEMLRDARDADTAAYAESRPLAHPPGEVFNYSSGSSMIVSAIAKRALGGGSERMAAFMRERLFEPLGMSSARPRFDGAGTFLGSSYLFANARDFARFGLLYLRDGYWDGEPILSRAWVDHARSVAPPSGGEYGAHWWLDVAEPGTFCAKGFQGQYTLVSPQRDMVVVRLGVSTEAQRVWVVEALAEILACFPAL